MLRRPPSSTLTYTLFPCPTLFRSDPSARPFGVWVGDPDAAEPTYRARSVIVSTGAQSLMLGLENEGRLIGHGVSTCATCDGFFFRDHTIAVVGGGDSAVEEATDRKSTRLNSSH